MAEQDSSSSADDDVRLKKAYTKASNLIDTEIEVAPTSTSATTDDSEEEKSHLEEESETTMVIGDVVLSLKNEASTEENDTPVTKNELSPLNEKRLQEAVLFVRQGERDDRFYNHPTENKCSRKAFHIVRCPIFYTIHLIVSVLLMLLSFAEDPRMGNSELTIEHQKAILTAHGVVEMLLLLFLTVDIILRICWFCSCHKQNWSCCKRNWSCCKRNWSRKPTCFFHKRTLFIVLMLMVMYLEALVVIGRQQSHFRVTRALRPVFFIDNYHMVGVRRILQQIFRCIKPIMDVLLLLLLIITVFSLLGYYLFAEVDPDYFSTLKRTFVSLFITMTTANHPDVMMEAYQKKPASPIFFIVYIFLTLYFISNILLAVVYSSFSKARKEKFKKQFLHRREALKKAHGALAGSSEGIDFHNFLLFMKEYRPRMPEWQVMCTFKALHTNPKEEHHTLSEEEFSSFYEVRDLKWDQVNEHHEVILKLQHFSPTIRPTKQFIYKLVKERWLDRIINVVLIMNVLFLVIYSLLINDPEERFQKLHIVLPVSLVLTLLYALEIVLKVIGFGPYCYFQSAWNIFDTLVVVMSLICIACEFHPNFIFVATARPIKLLRLIRLKRRYRDAMDTILVLLPRLSSVLFLLVVIYYFFAIIGMEFFVGRVGPGCCNTSWYEVGEYYAGLSTVNGSRNFAPSPDVYYLNNFDNILRSYVTLFILMVVNNWYIIMEGFVSQVEQGWLGRIYFMSFYVITLVVLQVAISFIVEAFVFKMQAIERSRMTQMCEKRKSTECTSCTHKRVNVKRKKIDIALVAQDILKLKEEIEINQSNQQCCVNLTIKRCRRGFNNIADISVIPSSRASLDYVGHQQITRNDMHLQMYKAELKDWITQAERDHEETKHQNTEETKETKQQNTEETKDSDTVCCQPPNRQKIREKFVRLLEYIIE